MSVVSCQNRSILVTASVKRDVDALVRQLLDDALQLPTPTEEECRRFYETNIRRFRSPTIWEPAHILLSASSDDEAARELARTRACEIIQSGERESGTF